MSISILNRGASGGLKPELTVIAPAGSTIDVLQGGIIIDTYALGADETEHTFVVKVGTYTVRGTLGSDYEEVEVLIDAVGCYAVTIEYKFYLYREGDECEDVTGGWAFSGDGTWDASKNDTDIYLYGQYVRGSHFGSVFMNTKDAVDMTKYTFLCVEYSDFACSGNTSAEDQGFRINGIICSKLGSMSDTGVVKADITSKTVEQVTLGLYPSTLSGSLTASINIHKIWLE